MIGVVIPIDYFTIQSGMAQRIKADLSALSYCGYNVEAILPTNMNQLKHRISPQVHLATYPNFQGFRFLQEKTRLLLDMYSQMFNPFFSSLLKKRYHRYSVIFAHSPTSVVASYRVVRQHVPVVYVAHDFEYGRVKQVWRNPLVRYFVYRIENYACSKASSIMCVSQSDMKAMETTYGVPVAKLSLLPNTTDVDFFSETRALYHPGTERQRLGLDSASFLLLFHGRMDYKANLEALEFILAELVPALRETAGNTKLIVVGAKIPKRCFSNRDEIISFYSDVPDMRRFLSVADAVIVPLSIGGGTRLKILESFAAKVPVISTAKGAEGIDCQDSRHLLIAQRNALDFIDKVNRLAEDESLRWRLADNAYKLVVRKYGIPPASKCLEKIITLYESRAELTTDD